MAVGFLHAGNASRDVTIALLRRNHKEDCAVHLVDPSLVETAAQDFPIDERRYEAIRVRTAELAARTERIVLTCSAYNAVAPWLQEDVGVPVERSDAAAARTLLRTTGPIGVLVSFLPARGIVVDYLSEVLASAEQSREIHVSLTRDAASLATSPSLYRDSLLEALRPLRACGALFLSQYRMHAHVDVIREAWGSRPLISAVEETVNALVAA